MSKHVYMIGIGGIRTRIAVRNISMKVNIDIVLVVAKNITTADIIVCPTNTVMNTMKSLTRMYVPSAV